MKNRIFEGHDDYLLCLLRLLIKLLCRFDWKRIDISKPRFYTIQNELEIQLPDITIEMSAVFHHNYVPIRYEFLLSLS